MLQLDIRGGFMYVSPMLLQKSDKPFDNNSWICEMKYDGIRLILSKSNNKIKLYTRHHNEVTLKFPELLNLKIPNGTILDGEIIVAGKNGKPDFEALMERFSSNKVNTPIQYVVFDIVYYQNKRVRLPLIERKELLEKVVPENNYHIVLTKWITGNGTTFFNIIKEQDLEGIVLKDSTSHYYINKRSNKWLKVINYKYQTVCINGLTKDKFGVLLSTLEGEPLGVMEFMNPSDKKLVYEQIKNLKIKETDKIVYLNPKLKCKVKYRNYTKNGKLRIPSFVEWVS